MFNYKLSQIEISICQSLIKQIEINNPQNNTIFDYFYIPFTINNNLYNILNQYLYLNPHSTYLYNEILNSL